jgi:hypothetical protein
MQINKQEEEIRKNESEVTVWWNAGAQMKVKYFFPGQRDYVHSIEVIRDTVASLVRLHFQILQPQFSSETELI